MCTKQLAVTFRPISRNTNTKPHLVFPLLLTLRGHISAPACKSHFTAHFMTAMTVLTGWRRWLWPRVIAGRVCFRCDLWPLSYGRQRALLCRSPDALSERLKHAQRLLHGAVGRRLPIAPEGHSVLVGVFSRFVHHLWHLIPLSNCEETTLNKRVKASRGCLPALCSTEECVWNSSYNVCFWLLWLLPAATVTGTGGAVVFTDNITACCAVHVNTVGEWTETCWEYVGTAVTCWRTQGCNIHWGWGDMSPTCLKILFLSS